MANIHWHHRPTIGVLAGWQLYRTATNFSYIQPVFRGINRAALEMDCNLLLGCGMGTTASPLDPIRPAWPVPAADVDFVPIGPFNADGLIVFCPLHSAAHSQYLQEQISSGYPILFLGSGEPGPTIVADNAAGITEAFEHLVEHGHRRIAFIAGSPDDMQGDTGERMRAYQSAAASYGFEPDPALISFGRHVFDGGFASARQLLESGVDFTAILASNDESALGAIQALKEAGRSVPQDVSVIGFDNRLEGATQDPPLSSVHVPLSLMGYRAVELMLAHLDGQIELQGTYRVNTRLVRRDSCGCAQDKVFAWGKPVAEMHRAGGTAQRAQWVQAITKIVYNQTQSLTETQCQDLSQRFVDAFAACLADNNRSEFLTALEEILKKTVAADDETYIWQEAISLLRPRSSGPDTAFSEQSQRVNDLLDQGMLTISAYMQRQHRLTVVDQRWSSRRLGLLTAALQTALDEASIYEILAEHLPDMNIHLAYVVLLEAEGEDSVAWSVLRNGIVPDQGSIRFASRDFSPAGLFGEQGAYQLALVPLVARTGQIGFVTFGTDQLDLYGSIVQQLGGAFNTARLYRQATEGRRLAEEANRMKSRFLSTISHELRTPLNLIVGLSGMVLRGSDEGDSPLPEAARNDIDRIHAYSQHLGGLIGDVIDLATSDAGQLHLNNENVNLSQALRMVAESGVQMAADKGLAFEASLPETGPWVWGDQTRLRQVALNLINNAIKFTTSGSVRLRLEDRGDSVTVMVSDTGLGISQDEQQVIFNEFRQSDRTVALGYGGLGLGLAICKRLVEMHGGTITVHSTGVEGAETTFAFTLPTIQMPVKNEHQLPKAHSLQQSVIVLTGQPGSIERLCEELHQRGFLVQITLMKRGLDWRAEINDSNPDAIILDVSTNSILGWETLKEIKSKNLLVSIPVLLFSSSHLDGSVLELDYLTKPIEISELTRALDQQWLMAEQVRPTRTILVVDDEPNTLEMHARIVQTHSSTNRILQARNGKEALALLRREVVDLVLLDLQMPEMDGFEVLEAMRGLDSLRKIPVIVVTGKDLTEADMARLNQGVATVLSKGLFSIDETIAHIRSALENKRRLSGEAQRLVRIAMAFVHENYAADLSRRVIAQHIGITEDHLTFCFRQELGTTPIDYLHRYRINQAKRLLKETQQTITEIALKVGFSDSGYFGRIFRRETGMTPEAFRRS